MAALECAEGNAKAQGQVLEGMCCWRGDDSSRHLHRHRCRRILVHWAAARRHVTVAEAERIDEPFVVNT